MVLNIFATLFVLGITFIHSIFGLFSGIVNVFCTITAMTVAFGYFEVVNQILTGQFHLHPSYTEPLAFVLLFVITLTILRYLADTFIRGNVVVHRWADWGGGAVCGFVIAQICIGVLVLGVQMLPLGGTVMMFTRYDREEENERDEITERVVFEEHNLLFQSDRFTVGLFSLLSGGSLSGPTHFARVYPDFTDWVWYTSNTVQEESLTAPVRSEDQDGFENGVAVEGWWTQDPPRMGDLYYRPEQPNEENVRLSRRTTLEKLPGFEHLDYKLEPEHTMLGVRLILKPPSSDIEPKKTFGFHRFRPTMIRVVGDVGTGDSATPRQFIPQIIGGADPLVGDGFRVADPDANFSIPGQDNMPVDVLFEVPEDFTPRFIEYRRHARAPLTAAQKQESPPVDRLAAPYRDERGQYTTGRLGSFVDTIIRDKSGETNALPINLNRNASASANFTSDALGSVEVGQVISGFVDELRGVGPGSVDEFAVPSGMRMLQFQTQAKKAQTLVGQIFNFVGGTTNTYMVLDTQGRQHVLAGYYALTNRDGRQHLTLFYTPNPQNVGYQGRLDKLDRVVRRSLERDDDAILGLVFVLPEGACVERIQAGGQELDLQETFCVGQ